MRPLCCGGGSNPFDRVTSQVFIGGLGAVSAAGWGVAPLLEALRGNQLLPVQHLDRPGSPVPHQEPRFTTLPGAPREQGREVASTWPATVRESEPAAVRSTVPRSNPALAVRRVPSPVPRPAWSGHARLRRASPISHYAVGAALEALGSRVEVVQAGGMRLGLVVCVTTGCVTYSQRFYQEVLEAPPTASPLLFPETVLNAPASHIAAYLGVRGLVTTLAGDQGAFLQGLAMAADWLADDRVDGAVVVAAHELHWLVAEALALFGLNVPSTEGAGALYLSRQPSGPVPVALDCVTDAAAFAAGVPRPEAARRVRAQLPPGGIDELLCESHASAGPADRSELDAWRAWPGTRLSVPAVLGLGLAADAAWQAVAACALIQSGAANAANVSIVGTHQQAVAARFQACPVPGAITGSRLNTDAEPS